MFHSNAVQGPLVAATREPSKPLAPARTAKFTTAESTPTAIYEPKSQFARDQSTYSIGRVRNDGTAAVPHAANDHAKLSEAQQLAGAAYKMVSNFTD